MVDRIYPTELQLNRANSSDTEAPFLDLNLCISNGTVSTKIYDKRDDFDFDIVNFPFLDGDVPRRTSYEVYISQLIRFARASSNLNDFNYMYRNKALTAKLLRQGYRYLPASLAQLDAPSDWRPGGRGFNLRRGRQHSFVEIDHEIFSTVILSLPLIQEGQLSVSGERYVHNTG